MVASSGLLYLLTAARDIVVGDTAEFVTAAVTLGVAHPPGYPLLTLLGHVFSWLPVGPEPFRVNLLAVCCGAGTVGLTYLTAERLTADRTAALAALLLAVNPVFWTWSLAAEAFPLNSLIAATLLGLLALWQEQPKQVSLLVAAALAAGLALSNHLTIVLLGPAVLFTLWRQRRILLARPQVLAVCVGAVLVGLLPYVYIPWAASRGPFLNWGRVSSWGDFVALVTRADYGTGQLVGDPANAGGAVSDRVTALLASFTIPEGFLIVLGAVQAYRRLRWYFWFTALAFGVAGPAFAAYANLNLARPHALSVLERFFLLPHVVVAPLAALGAVLVIDVVAALLGRGRRGLARAAVTLGVLAAVLLGLRANYRAIDQSKNHVARHYVEDILTTLEPSAILLVTTDLVGFPLAYLQAVEGQRPDVTPIWLPVLRGPAWYTQQLRARHADLVIPFSRYDSRSPTTSLKALVDANQGRPIALDGPPSDDSLRGSYWFRRGLVAHVEPVTKTIMLADLIRDYDRLVPLYRVPSFGSIKAQTFEGAILRAYAVPAQAVGEEYERVRYYADARTWYQRALAVDPSFRDAKDGLARIAAEIGR